MRTVTRALVASSLSVPLLLGGAGAAMASDYDSGHSSDKSYGKVWKKWVWNTWQFQEQSNETEQSNEADTTIYQIAVANEGDVEQNATVHNEQSNHNDTEQNQTQE